MLKEQARAVEGLARATTLAYIRVFPRLCFDLERSRESVRRSGLAAGQADGGNSSDQYALLFTLFRLLSWIVAASYAEHICPANQESVRLSWLS